MFLSRHEWVVVVFTHIRKIRISYVSNIHEGIIQIVAHQFQKYILLAITIMVRIQNFSFLPNFVWRRVTSTRFIQGQGKSFVLRELQN